MRKVFKRIVSILFGIVTSVLLLPIALWIAAWESVGAVFTVFADAMAELGEGAGGLIFDINATVSDWSAK